MDASLEFAKQGLGYLIAFLEAGVIFALARELKSSYEKRADDAKELTEVYVSTSRDLLNGNSTQQEGIKNILSILQQTLRKN